MHFLCISLLYLFIYLAGGVQVKLTTGILSFPERLQAYATGPHVALFSKPALASAEPSLRAALKGCGSVSGFLPPTSFLIHIAASAKACLVQVQGLAGLEGLAPLPPQHRVQPGGVEFDAGSGAPLRALTLSLAEGASHSALASFLAPHLAAHCGSEAACEVVPVHATEAAVTSLNNCSAACDLDSPPACGCAMGAALAGAAAQHPDVLWVERVYQAHTANAFGRGMMETSDLANFQSIVAEFGGCADDTCNLAGFLPFSQVVTTYGPLLPPPAEGAPASPPQQQRPHAFFEEVPRRTGVVHAPFNATAVLLAGHSSSSSSSSSSNESGTEGVCSPTCATPGCGFGFSLCAGLDTPTKTAGLDGTGQLIQVCDTGLDSGLPFFYDPAVPYPQNGTAPAAPTPPPSPAHRKIRYYWGYADAYDNDNGRGHGTHVAGSVAADAAGLGAALLPGDAPILSAMKGSASGAQLLVADIGCSTLGGCNRGPVTPPRIGNCNNGGLCIPTDISQLFEPAREAGAGVSCNSWGGLAASTYTAVSAAIDAYVFNQAPNFLIVWAAANSGNQGYYTISQQAASKNTLAVGALADGIVGHLAKIKSWDAAGAAAAPAQGLYQDLDGRACGGVKLNAAAQGANGLVQPGGTCPEGPALTDFVCYTLALSGQNDLTPPPGGFAANTQYGGAQQAELALCCGCTLQAIVRGCLNGGSGGAALSGPCGVNRALLSTLLQGFSSVYNARWPAPFSSLGPINDGRIKPEVAGTGFEIMSARSSGNFLYNTGWACPAAGGPITNLIPGSTPPGTAGSLYVSNSFTVPASEVRVFCLGVFSSPPPPSPSHGTARALTPPPPPLPPLCTPCSCSPQSPLRPPLSPFASCPLPSPSCPPQMAGLRCGW